MGLKFGTAEWISTYIETLNNNKAYEDAAKTWEGDFIFIIEPDGNLDHELRFYIDLWHGKARSGRVVGPDEKIDTAFVFSGKCGNATVGSIFSVLYSMIFRYSALSSLL